MNFYQHHIGDYASLTGHLTPMEDLAYRRALERYYKTEEPLELDTKRVARLLRLAEYPEAVEAVLQEFFVQTPEGWRNQRADEEIERMQEKQEVTEERDQHEKTRMQRHRERRSAMFAALAEVGIYPAFNAKTADLEAAMRDAGVTLGVTAPAQRSDGTGYGTGDGGDKPATASRARSPEPSPIPKPLPESLNTSKTTSSSPSPASPSPGLPGIDPEPSGEMPECPQQRILALWAELMPEMQQPVKWTGARATLLRCRWREEAVEHKWTTEDDGLRFFAKLFRWCRKSNFLMGKAPARNPGSTPFALTLPWLTKAENWAKVQEGNFHPER